ncbi:hypothetical protein K469DRAFT_724430 [Zopfia rhizophila CBS 207.26]|uniref:Rhodopsin domain-containing protein n=1 Tax=Zopfia rhizophila CBS 207.26 TaxID=1314779 RepID=A0A6A6DAZ4_9PEZI|nr:hypothetical protein K469DRAFT_724430 [Zopfia rhizophila CBS 207.26]
MAIDPDDPKYQPAAEQARQNMLIAVTVVMTAIGALVVGLRCFTRAYIVRNMGADDWTMVAALLFVFSYTGEIVGSAKANKMGYSGTQMSSEQMAGFVKMTLPIIVSYNMVLTCIKVSILLFYLRIAVRRGFEMLCKYTLWLIAIFQVINIIVTFTECVPLHKMWDFTGSVKGKCINTTVFFHFVAGFHILSDVWILVLPVKVVMSIQRPMREKIGLLPCASTHSPTNPFYDALTINLWSIIEVSIGLLCASLPTLRPLISKAQRDRTRAITGHGYAMHSRDKGTGLGTGILRGTHISISESCSTPVKKSRSDEGFAMENIVETKGKDSASAISNGSEEQILSPLEHAHHSK